MDGSSVEYDDDDMLGFEFTQSTDADAAAADVMSCDNDDQSVLCWLFRTHFIWHRDSRELH